jgi:hypothetical protein
MRMNKSFLTLFVGAGLLAIMTAAFLTFAAPQPLEAQTGVVRFSIVSAGKFYRAVPRTAISVTAGSLITPTGTYQRLSSAGTVTPTMGTATAGDLVTLINTTATTINLADSGIAKLSAAWAGGQYDTLTLRFDGTNWLELSRSDN